MKKGDVVTINDGSYSRSVVNGKSIHEVGLRHPNEQYTIIETDCKFPVVNPFQSMYEPIPRFNNTVIQAIDSGKIIFIEERFLELVPPKHKVMIDIVYHHGCMLCGMTVEISDELYRKIKDETQTK